MSHATVCIPTKPTLPLSLVLSSRIGRVPGGRPRRSRKGGSGVYAELRVDQRKLVLFESKTASFLSLMVAWIRLILCFTFWFTLLCAPCSVPKAGRIIRSNFYSYSLNIFKTDHSPYAPARPSRQFQKSQLGTSNRRGIFFFFTKSDIYNSFYSRGSRGFC